MNPAAARRTLTAPLRFAFATVLTAAFALSFAGSAAAEELATWDDYASKHELDCLAPFGTVKTPASVKVGKATVELHGHKAVIKGAGGKTAKLGVISAIKDHSPETVKNVERFVGWFKKQGVDAIIVNGDVAYEEQEIRENLEIIAKSGLIVLAGIGNSETVSAFNGAVKSLRGKYPNIFNLNHLRLVEIGAASLISLPGYFNRVFIHAAGGCHYRDTHVDELAKLVSEAKGAPVLISHGPPKGEGKDAIDYAVEAGNVGNPKLSSFIKDKGVKFGIFGHILEAGGRGVVADGSKAVKAKAWSDSLMLNAGSASATPWQMNDGKVSAGLALIMEVQAKRARFSADVIEQN